jgi:hypothetical protein
VSLPATGGDGDDGDAAFSALGKERKGSSSFLKKRTKKLLLLGSIFLGDYGKRIKVFCFFFSKKKYFLAYHIGSIP